MTIIEEALKIIFSKEINMFILIRCCNYEAYNDMQDNEEHKITLGEYQVIESVYNIWHEKKK